MVTQFIVLAFLILQACLRGAFAYEIKTSIKNSEDFKYKIVRAEVVLSEPTDCVWRLIRDPEKFPAFIPRVSKARRLGVENEREKYFIVLNPPFPFKDIINVLSVEFMEARRTIAWTLFDGNIKKHDGKVVLSSRDQGTKVDMDVSLDFGGAWPRSFVAWGVKYYLPKIFKSLNDKLKAETCARPPA